MEFTEIMNRIQKLANTPAMKIPDAVIASSLKDFEKKFKKSKALFPEFQKYFPGGI